MRRFAPPPADACGRFDALAASRYHTRDMSPDESAAFEAHLSDCAGCTDALEGQRVLDAALPRLPVYYAGAPEARHQRRRARAVRAAVTTATLAAAALLVAVRAARTRDRRDFDFRLVREAMAADAALLHAAGAPPAAAGSHPGRRDSLWARVPWLGFASCAADIEPRVDGVYLCVLDRGGPLGRGGARAGDVLRTVGERRVRTPEAMYEVLARHRIGDRVTVSYRQDGTERTASVVLTRRERSRRYPFDLEWSPALVAHAGTLRPGELAPESVFTVAHVRSRSAGAYAAGFVVRRRLTPGEWARVRLLASFPYPFTPGGLRPGDTITAVRSVPARSWSAFLTAYGRDGGRELPLTVRRGGSTLELRIESSPPATR